MIGALLLGVLAEAVVNAAGPSSGEYRREMLAYLERRGLAQPRPSRKSPAA